jgi:hypothetical protein
LAFETPTDILERLNGRTGQFNPKGKDQCVRCIAGHRNQTARLTINHSELLALDATARLIANCGVRHRAVIQWESGCLRYPKGCEAECNRRLLGRSSRITGDNPCYQVFQMTLREGSPVPFYLPSGLPRSDLLRKSARPAMNRLKTVSVVWRRPEPISKDLYFAVLIADPCHLSLEPMHRFAAVVEDVTEENPQLTNGSWVLIKETATSRSLLWKRRYLPSLR